MTFLLATMCMTMLDMCKVAGWQGGWAGLNSNISPNTSADCRVHSNIYLMDRKSNWNRAVYINLAQPSVA